mmetsp:Transcript_11377/g.34471  ORF Transcript_11377/g.34471 Transcript_11377/m.34471 type:complete len:324 (+) Transcript_11377:2342-3313(+)
MEAGAGAGAAALALPPRLTALLPLLLLRVLLLRVGEVLLAAPGDHETLLELLPRERVLCAGDRRLQQHVARLAVLEAHPAQRVHGGEARVHAPRVVVLLRRPSEVLALALEGFVLGVELGRLHRAQPAELVEDDPIADLRLEEPVEPHEHHAVPGAEGVDAEALAVDGVVGGQAYVRRYVADNVLKDAPRLLLRRSLHRRRRWRRMQGLRRRTLRDMLVDLLHSVVVMHRPCHGALVWGHVRGDALIVVFIDVVDVVAVIILIALRFRTQVQAHGRGACAERRAERRRPRRGLLLRVEAQDDVLIMGSLLLHDDEVRVPVDPL